MFKILNMTNSHEKRTCVVEPEVHYYDVSGKHFVFDSNSLCALEVDKALFLDIQTRVTSKTFAGLLQCPLVPQFNLHTDMRVKQLVLEATHACNLKCSYCFVGSCYEDGHEAHTLSFKQAKIAIDRLLWSNLNIGFFGGEPLLNWELVKQVVRYVKNKAQRLKKDYKFHVTTNGTLLDKEKIKYLNENNFSMIISLDGDEEIHNSHRQMKNGENSFQKTMNVLELIKGLPLARRVTLRSTYTGDGAQLVRRLSFLNNLCDEGYANSVSVEPVCLTENACIRLDAAHNDALTYKMLSEEPKWREEYHEAALWATERFMNNKPMRFHHFFKPIERLLWTIHSPSECGAGKGYMAVNGKGELFACHREYLSDIGTLQHGINEYQRAKWIDNRVYARPVCMKCDIRYICGGGCRLESLSSSGNIHIPEQTGCWLRHTCLEEALYVISEVGTKQIAKFIKNPRVKYQQKGMKR